VSRREDTIAEARRLGLTARGSAWGEVRATVATMLWYWAVRVDARAVKEMNDAVSRETCHA